MADSEIVSTGIARRIIF